MNQSHKILKLDMCFNGHMIKGYIFVFHKIDVFVLNCNKKLFQEDHYFRVLSNI